MIARSRRKSPLMLLLPLFVMVLLLFGGFGAIARWHHFGKIRVSSENRNSVEFPMFSFQSWSDGSFQKNYRMALCDYPPLAVELKKRYFQFSNGMLWMVQKELFDFTDYYVNFRNQIWIYGNASSPNLLNRSKNVGKISQKIREHCNAINNAAVSNPETSFYFYYVTRDVDFLFESNSATHYFDTVRHCLKLTDDHIAQLQISSFEDFCQKFFRTDHHWNQFGAYQAYKDIFQLLKLGDLGESVIAPTVSPDASENGQVHTYDSILLSQTFVGSKSHQTGTCWKFYEDFYYVSFDLPPLQITRNDTLIEYGSLHPSYVSYVNVFGDNIGELVFSTGREDRLNCIIIGDSFDNPILKLLASHFNKTHSIDLRCYSEQTGKRFVLNDYVNKHGIDIVLFIENESIYYTEAWNEF